MVFARYAAFFVPAGDMGIRVMAVALILALSALNYVGVKPGSRVQTALTVAKVAAIVDPRRRRPGARRRFDGCSPVSPGRARGGICASSCSRWWRDSSRTAAGTW